MSSSVKPASRGAASRERLLRAAADELVETGELEVARVARRAGVSAGLPYRYFGTRSGLLIAVVEDFHERLGEAAVFRSFDLPTWRAREHARLRAWVEFLYREPLAGVVLGGLTGDGEVAAAGARRLAEAIAVGARNMLRGQRDGELPPHRDPELLAAAVLGGVHSTVAIALARRPRPPVTRVVDELWAFVTGAVGLAPPEARP